MATLNEIAYNIKNLVSGGVASDDSDLSLRQIKFMVHYHRANLLIQYTDNGKKASNAIFQVHQVKPSNAGVDLGIVGFNDNRGIRSIAYKDDSGVESSYVPLPIVQNHDRMFVNSARFMASSNGKVATLSDRKLYVWEGESTVGDGFLEVNGVFTNPTIVSSYESDETSEYPIPEELIALLVQNVLQLEFNVILSNNAKTPNNQVDENATSKEPGVQ